jgi:hypothetical protein
MAGCPCRKSNRWDAISRATAQITLLKRRLESAAAAHLLELKNSENDEGTEKIWKMAG